MKHVRAEDVDKISGSVGFGLYCPRAIDRIRSRILFYGMMPITVPLSFLHYLLQNPYDKVSHERNNAVSSQSYEEDAMTTVETIERAIKELPPDELAKLRRWFFEFDAAAWDAQIEADAAAGKFDA